MNLIILGHMNVTEAINNRYSSRYYKGGEVTEEVIDKILEAGQKAPSGFGSEPWQFYVLRGNLDEVYKSASEQDHVKEASFVIALVNYKKKLLEDDPSLIEEKYNSFDEAKKQRYISALVNKGDQYLREQLMFAASFMVLEATNQGLGSVIIGGFDPKSMEEILDIDTNYYEVGLMISFGIDANDTPTKRTRRATEDVVRKVTLK